MTNKSQQEIAVFENFLHKLRNSSDYEQLVSDITFAPSDSPDIEIELKGNPPSMIGLEITRYILDGKLVKNKKNEVKIISELRFATQKRIEAGEEAETGGFYGIGKEELEATIQKKSNLHQQIYKTKNYSEYWLLIYSDNEHPYEFIGNAELPEVLLYKCNKSMRDISHPFQKVFLFCNEVGGSWICELSDKSKLLYKELR
jgi:hypothetical protein